MQDQEPLDDVKTAAEELSAARRRVWTRSLLAVAVCAVGAWALSAHAAAIDYFFNAGDRIDLGDIRELRASGTETLPARPGSWVHVENLMVTHPAEGRKYKYFFCPVYDIVVRTTRPLPEPSIRVDRADVTAGLEFLLEERRVFVEDFTTHFDADGWLMRLTDAREWSGGLEKYAVESLKLEPRQVSSAWMLYDGETPGSMYWALFVLVSVVLVTLSAGAGLVLAVRTLRRLRRSAG